MAAAEPEEADDLEAEDEAEEGAALGDDVRRRRPAAAERSSGEERFLRPVPPAAISSTPPHSLSVAGTFNLIREGNVASQPRPFYPIRRVGPNRCAPQHESPLELSLYEYAPSISIQIGWWWWINQ